MITKEMLSDIEGMIFELQQHSDKKVEYIGNDLSVLFEEIKKALPAK